MEKEYVVQSPLKHDGKDYEIGETFKCDEHTAKDLIAQGVLVEKEAGKEGEEQAEEAKVAEQENLEHITDTMGQSAQPMRHANDPAQAADQRREHERFAEAHDLESHDVVTSGDPEHMADAGDAEGTPRTAPLTTDKGDLKPGEAGRRDNAPPHVVQPEGEPDAGHDLKPGEAGRRDNIPPHRVTQTARERRADDKAEDAKAKDKDRK
jgi:hypothetical protein